MKLISRYTLAKYLYALLGRISLRKLKSMLLKPPTLSAEEISAALQELPINPGDDVMIHGSLSAFGHIEGGAETVVDVLLKVIGPQGNLLAPSFSRFEVRIGEFGRWWDPLSTPVYTGAISDAIWRRPSALRSFHPTHAVAALGPRSKYYITGHNLTGDRPSFWGTGAFSSDSPWQKMVDENVHYLMFGCGFGPATLCHHVETFMVAEDLAGLPESEYKGFTQALRHNYYHPDGAWPDINRTKLAKAIYCQGSISSIKLGWASIEHIRAADYFEAAIALCRANQDEWFSPKYRAWQKLIQSRRAQIQNFQPAEHSHS